MSEIEEKYYDYVLNGIEVSKAEAIVFKIIQDLTDRRGLKQEFNSIDDDIKEEIFNKWIGIANTNL